MATQGFSATSEEFRFRRQPSRIVPGDRRECASACEALGHGMPLEVQIFRREYGHQQNDEDEALPQRNRQPSVACRLLASSRFRGAVMTQFFVETGVIAES
jgi:hypothetical protein